MAQPQKAYIPETHIDGGGGLTAIQAVNVTLDGSGATSDFVFTTLLMDKMVDALYQVIAMPITTHTLPIQVTTKATTGFTLTHDSGSSDVV